MLTLAKESAGPLLLAAGIAALSALCGNLLAVKLGVHVVAYAI